MTEIINEQQYEVAMQRIEELLPLVDDKTPTNDRNYIELDMISNLVSDYEEKSKYKFMVRYETYKIRSLLNK